MGISTMRVYEYYLECDLCGRDEVYHTYDIDNDVKVHSIASAIRAAKFHRSKGKLVCPICYEDIVYQRTHKRSPAT